MKANAIKEVDSGTRFRFRRVRAMEIAHPCIKVYLILVPHPSCTSYVFAHALLEARLAQPLTQVEGILARRWSGDLY
jgi:hypothetical protein